MSLMPDRLAKGKTMDREYFFNCVNTVHPEFTRQMIDHANGLRFKSGQEDNAMTEVKVSDHWWEELNAMPFISCKCHFDVFVLVPCGHDMLAYADAVAVHRAQGHDHPPAEGRRKARRSQQEA